MRNRTILGILILAFWYAPTSQASMWSWIGGPSPVPPGTRVLERLEAALAHRHDAEPLADANRERVNGRRSVPDRTVTQREPRPARPAQR